MKLPERYIGKEEWTLIGPMGPSVPKELLCHGLIGIDGGARFAPEMDLWVGDSDSHSGKINALHTFHHPKEKAQSDLALGFMLLEQSLPYRLHLWGLLGGRQDHQLFNLGEALSWLSSNPGSEILFYDSSQIVRFHLFAEGRWSFHHQGLFSLGTIHKVSLELSGHCKYPIIGKQQLPPLSSLGLSNMAHGDVNLENSGPCFVYFPEDK